MLHHPDSSKSTSPAEFIYGSLQVGHWIFSIHELQPPEVCRKPISQIHNIVTVWKGYAECKVLSPCKGKASGVTDSRVTDRVRLLLATARSAMIYNTETNQERLGIATWTSGGGETQEGTSPRWWPRKGTVIDKEHYRYNTFDLQHFTQKWEVNREAPLV